MNESFSEQEAPAPVSIPPPQSVRVAMPSLVPMATYSILGITVLIYLLQMASMAMLNGDDLPLMLGARITELIYAGQWWRPCVSARFGDTHLFQHVCVVIPRHAFGASLWAWQICGALFYWRICRERIFLFADRRIFRGRIHSSVWFGCGGGHLLLSKPQIVWRSGKTGNWQCGFYHRNQLVHWAIPRH